VNTKEIPIYFYYLSVERTKSKDDGTTYDIQKVAEAVSLMLSSLCKKDLVDRKHNFPSAEKVIWLESFDDLKNGNMNLIFKSAKYNQSRTVINTDTMVEKGIIKEQQDGDEEKTHLCIRLAAGQNNFLSVHESNYYGIGIGSIVSYLNKKFDEYQAETNDSYCYQLSYNIMPSDDFLEELSKMQKISLLQLTIERQDFQNDFLRLAERDDVKDTVDIRIGKIAKKRYIPLSLIKEYYGDMQAENRIKRIIAEGTNQSGTFKLDTELIKMKHCLKVERMPITNEVKSEHFFTKAQEFVDEMRRGL